MSDLLALAIAAHGGIDRWDAFTRLTAEVSVAGAIWELKQQPGLLLHKVFEIETHNKRVSITPFGGVGQRSLFIPGRLVVETSRGEIVEARDNPGEIFKGPAFKHPWDRLQDAFSASEALWTYLTSPFLYTYPGFQCEEIEPWQENGEEWRRLKVVFPDHVGTHTKAQVTYFGADGLMRRHDCTVDLLSGNTGANYLSDYRDVQGLMMPATRRVYAYDGALRKIPEPLLVTIDFGAMTFS
jgi:hypothetical protein